MKPKYNTQEQNKFDTNSNPSVTAPSRDDLPLPVPVASVSNNKDNNQNTNTSEKKLEAAEHVYKFSAAIGQLTLDSVIQMTDIMATNGLSMKENYKGYQTYRNVKQVINGVQSYYKMMASSIGAGVAFGGAGILVGALVGSGAAIIRGITDQMSINSANRLEISTSNTNNTFAMERLGLTSGSRGTEN